MKKPFDIRTMDSLDEWTEWDDDTPADWWLNHPLHHPAARRPIGHYARRASFLKR
jgi:hypothetical protein